MAALVFFAVYFGEQFVHIGKVWVQFGFSIGKLWEFLKIRRKQVLFDRYLQELISDSENCVENSTKQREVIQNISQQQHRFLRDSCKAGKMEEIEVVDGFVEVPMADATFYDSIDPHLVYTNRNLGEIHQGVSFTVKGDILPNCERFSINLVLDTPHHDIALHINPRLPQNYIVRNCRVKNCWGTEEVTSALPFSLHRGDKFTIQILVTETDYLISVNGHHFASFRHRLPYNRVTCLEVKGDVENIVVDQMVAPQYPEMLPETAPKPIQKCDERIIANGITTPSADHVSLQISNFSQNRSSIRLPYYGVLPDPLLCGKRLRIEGRVKILPHSFYVNLQNGHKIWPHPIIAFHLNPRFANIGGKHVICRNSWFDGQWDREERTEQKTDFTPGKHFTLTINCTSSAYEVFLNNKFIAEYQFRVDPKTVDTVYLQGDIKLWDIVLEDSPIHNDTVN